MKDQQNITIKIADVNAFSLLIDRDQEEIVREAERNVNKVWSAWRRDFSDKSSKEVLGMVAYQYAKLYYQLLKQVEMQESILSEFEQDLDKVLLNSDNHQS